MATKNKLSIKTKTPGEPSGKRYVALARVSSREQEKEGFSLDVQVDALNDYALKEGGRIVKLWRLAETATKAEQRTSFKELLAYAKQNAPKLDGLLVYKVDRAARNMSDYGKLEELESTYGLPLIATSQPMQDNPAGRMARRMLASMAAFFTDQLSLDVREGLGRCVREGWFPTVPPYGYVSVRENGRSTVRIEPAEAENVKRIFHLYAFENCTLDMAVEKLKAEGRIFTPKQPIWQRSKVHRVLRDRSYTGDIKYHDGWQPGKHEPLVDLNTFTRVQKLLGDKIYKAHELTYGSELITCGHCGRPITGEIVVKKKSGKSYIYYRCARYTAKDHPRDRLREEEIDEQMIALFDRIKQPQVVQKWFRTALLAWSGHHHEQSRARARDVQKQMDDVRKQQERLLNLHLSAAIDDQAYNAKSVELRDRIASLTLELEAADRKKDERADLAVKVFELSQNLTKKWVTAEYSEKRRLMEMICLNIVLKGKTLCISTRKPFNCLVEGLSVSGSGEAGIRTLVTV